jgi:cephalosporin hydroxylase
MRVSVGTRFPDRDQPKLSRRESRIVRRFHQLYYSRWAQGADSINLSWFGYPLLKCPLDLWIYQELIVRTQPDYVIETGTWAGGSALFFAMLFDQIGHGHVITIDIESNPDRPRHPRITYITGSSVNRTITTEVSQQVDGNRAMVVLDSDHHADHVFEELIAFSPLVKSGDYLIVEDTNINGHPVAANFGPGPMEAVQKFLSENRDFFVDRRCERFLMTLHPHGYLTRL